MIEKNNKILYTCVIHDSIKVYTYIVFTQQIYPKKVT